MDNNFSWVCLYLLQVTLLDKYLNDFVAMGLGTSASGIAVVIIPMLYNYYGTLFFSFLNGIGNSIYDLSKSCRRGVKELFFYRIIYLSVRMSYRSGKTLGT